jgi:catechol 2,3-dioxygenase-like lactoylglutathione lyase family enzyme
MRFGQRVEQIAYVVSNVWEAAELHSRQYGSGPFFAMDHAPAIETWYRGKFTRFDANCALGQCGDVMIELLHDNGTGPSIIHDLYPAGSGRGGLHHLCYHVDDLAVTIAEFEAEGCPVAFRTRMMGGTDVVMLDTVASVGHFVEIYEKSDEVRGLYDYIRKASIGFDGRVPVRPMESLLQGVGMQ